MDCSASCQRSACAVFVSADTKLVMRVELSHRGAVKGSYTRSGRHSAFRGGAWRRLAPQSRCVQFEGEVLVTDCPYIETKEHIGGFWILEAANMDEALEWGRKAAVACRAPVEVRAFNE